MRGNPKRYADLGGGVDLRLLFADAPTDASRWAFATDITSDRSPTARIRGGTSRFKNVPGVITLYASEVTSPSALLIATGTQLHAYAADGTTAVSPVTYACIVPDFVAAPPVGGQGPVYILDGASPRYFTGSAFGTWTASAGTLPLGKYLTQWQQRLWIAGASAKPASLYASDINDPRNWDTTVNALEVQLDPWDGQEITGIGASGEYLIAFKRTKVFVINDPDSGANRRLGAGVGCVSHQSIAGSPYGLFFLSQDGVYLTDGNDLKRISDPIQPLIDAASFDDGIWPNGRACFFNDRYYLSFLVDATVNGHPLDRVTVEYDPVTKAWWIHKAWTRSNFTVWHRDSKPEVYGSLTLTDHTSDVVRLFDPELAEDLSEPIEGTLTSPWHNFGDPSLRRRCRAIHVSGHGDYDLAIGRDWEDEAASTPELSPVPGLGGGTDVTSEAKRALSPGVARAWQLRLSGITGGIDSYTMFMDGTKN